MNEENNQSKKTFIKQWWFWVIIIFIGFFTYVQISDHKSSDNKDKSKDFSQKQTQSDSTKNMVLSDDLPACPADTSALFTKPFMAGNKPDFIIPLGNSGMVGHVTPVDHVYPSNNAQGEVGPVYAPGRITLVWIENKQIYYKDTGEEVAPDFQLNFAPCRGINLAFIHLTKLSDKLKNALTEPVNSGCSKGEKLDYGQRNGRDVNYQTCHPRFNKVTLEPGEYMGDYGFTSNVQNVSGFDIGLYDFNKPAVGFITPQRYYEETNQTACFADYYTPELRSLYYTKFGNYENGNFVPVSGNPKCGKIMWDVAGTASGDWFKNKLQRANITDNDSMILIHDNIKSELAKFTIANQTSFIFTPKHSGTINREFSEVTADSKVYCYQQNELLNQVSTKDKKGNPMGNNFPKYLLQLVDDTHIKVEQKTGTCSTNESLTNPVIYER